MILTVTLNAAIDKRYVVDDFKVGEVNRVKECSYVPGGKGLNVSKPASIYGAEVVATGFVGGHAGNYIEDALKPFGIRGDFYHVDAESRSCINIWDEVNHVQTEFLEPGFTLTEEDFQGFEKKFRELVQNADVVSMSGSVPKGLDGTAYQSLVRIVKEAGKPVILDTSGKLLELGIEACPTLIKPNIDEIRMLTGKQCDNMQDIMEAAKAIHAKYGDDFDVLFGPAYKGIPLSVVTAIAFSELYGKEIRYCSDRKEEKDHGADKGSFLGSKLKDGDRVVMIEDVTTSGKSMEETVPKVKGAADVEIVGLMVSLDRMEVGKGGVKCALDEVHDLYGFETNAIVTMAEVIEHLYNKEYKGQIIIDDDLKKAIDAYYSQYGAK